MKWTGSLIRISEHEIDQLRLRLAAIVERRQACERALTSLAAEAVAETERARGDAQAGWYLIGFRQGWAVRKARALAELYAVQQEESGARDALAKVYEDLKKVEQVAEAGRRADAKAEARRESAALDELALRRSVGE